MMRTSGDTEIAPYSEKKMVISYMFGYEVHANFGFLPAHTICLQCFNTVS